MGKEMLFRVMGNRVLKPIKYADKTVDEICKEASKKETKTIFREPRQDMFRDKELWTEVDELPQRRIDYNIDDVQLSFRNPRLDERESKYINTDLILKYPQQIVSTHKRQGKVERLESFLKALEDYLPIHDECMRAEEIETQTRHKYYNIKEKVRKEMAARGEGTRELSRVDDYEIDNEEIRLAYEKYQEMYLKYELAYEKYCEAKKNYGIEWDKYLHS